jgi:hypothetical protein
MSDSPVDTAAPRTSAISAGEVRDVGGWPAIGAVEEVAGELVWPTNAVTPHHGRPTGGWTDEIGKGAARDAEMPDECSDVPRVVKPPDGARIKPPERNG